MDDVNMQNDLKVLFDQVRQALNAPNLSDEEIQIMMQQGAENEEMGQQMSPEQAKISELWNGVFGQK